MTKTLRLVLGDQLNPKHSWFQSLKPNYVYVLMEILPETAYVTHHIQKIVGFFSAMRSFAREISDRGHTVIYFHLDDPRNRQSFALNLELLIHEQAIGRIEYQLPDEYRLDQLLGGFAETIYIPTRVYDSEHFITSRNEVADFFKGKKTFVMESFYRHVRKKTGILMDAAGPLSGRWNYDSENRKSLPKEAIVPPPLVFRHEVLDIVKMLQRMGVTTIGNIDPNNFPWPISRKEALLLFDSFLENYLEHFGTYQDAMSAQHPFVYHSRLSFAMNIKLLSPLEIVKKTVDYWQKNAQQVGIAQVEGFLRQIVGWREFMRGVYWIQMPQYEHLNFFNHQNKLPLFYWTGNTRMNCLHIAIKQSLDFAYAHHIQRLMVTGNFANLLCVHPDEVDKWYLGIYIDAIQWVEITNTRGMSQYADGGIVATKPYVSSANYINKMSNYCENCYYNYKKRHGEKACPFNSFYWDFFDRYRKMLQNNPRIGMAYRTLDKMDVAERQKIKEQAQKYRENRDKL